MWGLGRKCIHFEEIFFLKGGQTHLLYHAWILGEAVLEFKLVDFLKESLDVEC